MIPNPASCLHDSSHSRSSGSAARVRTEPIFQGTSRNADSYQRLSIADQVSRDLTNPFSNGWILNFHAGVGCRLTAIDQRREFYTIVGSHAGVIVRAPNVFLPAAGIEQDILRIGVQFA